MTNQEKVFKWLWPEKCWHTFHAGMISPDRVLNYAECKFCQSQESNPSLSTPEGMVMILDRLVEMGYGYVLNGDVEKYGGIVFTIFSIKYIRVKANIPHLAVFEAISKLVEREGEDGRRIC